MNERIKEFAEESGMTQYVASNNKFLEQFAELIRAEALEEAAKACEEQSRESGVAKYPFWNDCAAAIRGLK